MTETVDVLDINVPMYIGAILVVLALLGLFALFLRWIQGNVTGRSSYRGREMAILETQSLDAVHRLVLVRCRSKGYLMVLSRNKIPVVVGRDLPLDEESEGDRPLESESSSLRWPVMGSVISAGPGIGTGESHSSKPG